MTDTLRDRNLLKVLLFELKTAKITYCYQLKSMNTPDKYGIHYQLIHKSFESSYFSYGYRIVHYDLKDANMPISKKII